MKVKDVYHMMQCMMGKNNASCMVIVKERIYFISAYDFCCVLSVLNSL